MATEAQIIEHLRKLSQYRERPECDDDGIPYYASCGNIDDAWQIGTEDGEIMLAQSLIEALDNDGPLPDLPDEDDEDDE